MNAYCQIANGHPVHQAYHDHEYGVPQGDESILFERLVLEINQAGLSWSLMLQKRDHFRRAYRNFAVDLVANFDHTDVQRLRQDAGIVRNQRKILAVIHNARVIAHLRRHDGGFAGWLDAHHPRALPEWVQLFRRTFQFTGQQITQEFLMSLGYLPGAHNEDCPAYQRILAMSPPWLRTNAPPDDTATGI